jgi:hypothetical protein
MTLENHPLDEIDPIHQGHKNSLASYITDKLPSDPLHFDESQKSNDDFCINIK